MALHPDLEVKQMKQNDKAYCWVGQNFAEDHDGALEQLSVRFKYTESASQFNNIVQQGIEKLKSRANQ